MRLVVAYLLARRLSDKGSKVMAEELTQHAEGARPGFAAAISAPLVAILLLSLRPIAGIAVDPLIALPVGGLAGALLMGRIRQCNQFMVSGLSRMAPVAIMLLGTGTLAGIIANSALKDVLINGLTHTGLPARLLAPLSGALMSMATASTTAGTAVASGVFSSTLLELGVSGLAGAAMIHAGATVLDHLPHGSFFHATGGSVNMAVHERLKLLPYETLVGFTIAAISALMFGVFNPGGIRNSDENAEKSGYCPGFFQREPERARRCRRHRAGIPPNLSAGALREAADGGRRRRHGGVNGGGHRRRNRPVTVTGPLGSRYRGSMACWATAKPQ